MVLTFKYQYSHPWERKDMKKTQLKNRIIFAVIFGLVFIFYSALAIAQGSNDTSEKQTSPKKSAIEQIKESVLDAKTEADVAGQEVEVRKKAIELEKKKADVERRESELAKKEAEVIKETAESRMQVKKAIQRVEQEEKEAVAAVEMVAISEEKMLIAQEKARIAQEQLEIEKGKADVAEAKARARRNIVFVKIFQTILVLVFGYLLIFFLVGAVNRGVKDLKAKHLIRKDIVYILNFIIIVAVILVWGHNVESLTIFISAVGAGVAVALHEAILCIAGWLLILLRRPYEVGDRVELGGVKGDVIDIQLFHTALLEIGN